jgi:hypothetical protein
MSAFFSPTAGALRPLRQHRESALEALRASLLPGHRQPMLQASTGAGKTLLAAHIIECAEGQAAFDPSGALIGVSRRRSEAVEAVRENKDLARTRAIARWPARAELFARKCDIDRAEAALIGFAGIMREGTQ